MFSKPGHVCLCVWALKGFEKCYKFPLACVPCWGGSDVLMGSYRGHEVLRGAMGQKVPEFRNKKGQSAVTSLQRRPLAGTKDVTSVAHTSPRQAGTATSAADAAEGRE